MSGRFYPVRFHVLSDLHVDSYGRRGLRAGEIPQTDSDAILIAGDIANGLMGVDWLIEQVDRLQKPLFFITGNHDYYGSNLEDQDALIRKRVAGTGVTFLQKDAVDFAGVRILGTTLWTDFCYQATESTLSDAVCYMRDFSQIVYHGRLFEPVDSIALHQAQRDWLLAQLQQANSEGVPTVVMTHHSISPLSVAAKYANFSSNAGFVTDLSAWLTAPYAPKLWLHGHTHEAFDYVQGNTRVVVNPRAYPGEESSTGLLFDWQKVVTITRLSDDKA